ncbi:hypothetical protein L9F63_001684, partial [Diploptera punctata]
FSYSEVPTQSTTTKSGKIQIFRIHSTDNSNVLRNTHPRKNSGSHPNIIQYPESGQLIDRYSNAVIQNDTRFPRDSFLLAGNLAFQTGFWITLNLNLSYLHLMSHVLEALVWAILRSVELVSLQITKIKKKIPNTYPRNTVATQEEPFRFRVPAET